MDKFAFIFHPHDVESLGDWVLEDFALKYKRHRLVERTLRWIPPFRRETVTGIKSDTGEIIEGDMILLPLVPEQIIRMDEKFILNKIISAGKVAKNFGAKIIGLGAYAACIGKRGNLFAEALNIAVTTGTCYTIATAIKAVLKAADEIDIDLKNAKVAVIGATGTIGTIVSYMLSSYTSDITLIAHNPQRLENLSESISVSNKAIKIQVSNEILQGIKNKDIIVIVTNTPEAIIDVDYLPPGSVTCDLSLPHNISKNKIKERKDILVIDGGVVKPPGKVDFHFNFGLSPGLAYACMAETMILTLEKRFESYSLGGNVTLEKVREIGELGEKHGFELAKFRSFGKEVDSKNLSQVKNARLLRK